MAIDREMLLVIESAGLGDGGPDLGEKLMCAFLSGLLASGTTPDRAIFMSSGVYLTTEDSPVAEQLCALAAAGCRITSCATSLAFFDRRDQLVVGEVEPMEDTVRAMLDHARVLRP